MKRPEDIPVTKEFEELANIEDVRVGDYVLSWNEKTKKTGYAKVLNTFVRKTDLIYTLKAGKDSLETTWNHPFYVVGSGVERTANGEQRIGGKSADSSSVRSALAEKLSASYNAKMSHSGYSASLVSAMQVSEPSEREGHWVQAKDLRAGDTVMKSDGTLLKIESIKSDKRTETVYNFEVAGNHTYFVGEEGVLVHNECLVGDMGNGITSEQFDAGREKAKEAGNSFLDGLKAAWDGTVDAVKAAGKGIADAAVKAGEIAVDVGKGIWKGSTVLGKLALDIVTLKNSTVHYFGADGKVGETTSYLGFAEAFHRLGMDSLAAKAGWRDYDKSKISAAEVDDRFLGLLRINSLNEKWLPDGSLIKRNSDGTLTAVNPKDFKEVFKDGKAIVTQSGMNNDLTENLMMHLKSRTELEKAQAISIRDPNYRLPAESFHVFNDTGSAFRGILRFPSFLPGANLLGEVLNYTTQLASFGLLQGESASSTWEKLITAGAFSNGGVMIGHSQGAQILTDAISKTDNKIQANVFLFGGAHNSVPDKRLSGGGKMISFNNTGADWYEFIDTSAGWFQVAMDLGKRLRLSNFDLVPSAVPRTGQLTYGETVLDDPDDPKNWKTVNEKKGGYSMKYVGPTHIRPFSESNHFVKMDLSEEDAAKWPESGHGFSDHYGTGYRLDGVLQWYAKKAQWECSLPESPCTSSVIR